MTPLQPTHSHPVHVSPSSRIVAPLHVNDVSLYGPIYLVDIYWHSMLCARGEDVEDRYLPCLGLYPVAWNGWLS